MEFTREILEQAPCPDRLGFLLGGSFFFFLVFCIFCFFWFLGFCVFFWGGWVVFLSLKYVVNLSKTTLLVVCSILLLQTFELNLG